MLCAWLTASFTAQNLPASPMNAPTPSAETNLPSAEPAVEAATNQKDIEEQGITAPVVLLK